MFPSSPGSNEWSLRNICASFCSLIFMILGHSKSKISSFNHFAATLSASIFTTADSWALGSGPQISVLLLIVHLNAVTKIHWERLSLSLYKAQGCTWTYFLQKTLRPNSSPPSVVIKRSVVSSKLVSTFPLQSLKTNRQHREKTGPLILFVLQYDELNSESFIGYYNVS